MVVTVIGGPVTVVATTHPTDRPFRTITAITRAPSFILATIGLVITVITVIVATMGITGTTATEVIVATVVTVEYVFPSVSKQVEIQDDFQNLKHFNGREKSC